MSHEGLATLPIGATMEDAELILQRLAGSSSELLKARLPEAETRAVPTTPPAHGEETPRRPGTPDPEARETPRSLPRLSEKTLLNVLETAPDAIVVIDGRGVIVLVNAQTEKMFGYQRAELIGEKVEILVPVRNRAKHVPQRREFFQKPFTREMGSGKPLFGVRKDGREFPVEISLSPLETDAGMLVTSAIRDVTERKMRDARLAKAEARYRSLVEEIPAVTFMADLEGDINEMYVSPQIEKLLGFSQQEWLDDPVLWHRQLHPEDRDRWHVEFARTCATAEPFRSVYRFLARDGRVVWVHGEAKVVRDKDGRPLFLQGVAFDITGMKSAEEELRMLNQTLDDRVTERTAEAELKSKELARSNRDLEHFGFMVAHDLRKPLHAILPEADELAKKVRAKQARESIALIAQKAKSMDLLISKMLDYSRVGKEKRQSVPVDCKVLFREARAELQKEIDAIGAAVSAEPLPTVLGERETLKLLFRNLIDNAIKYRAPRRLKIRIGAKLENGACQFWVRDNGKGVKKEYLEKIFVMFKRLEEEKIPGHGIGMAFCQRVVEHHGGRIWVESVFGKGSTFFFTLPACGEG
jgi:PAS domain S-box-containing protein